MTLVWYAAYGSNTDEARFRRYLAGCTPPADAIDTRPVTIDLPLYFAGASSGTWGPGGVAFVGPEREPAPSTLARAWLVPAEVLAQIGAQENRLPPAAGRLDPGGGDQQAFPGRWYDEWRACGDLDGVAVFTLTSSVARRPRTRPGRPYATVVARGLREAHEMTPDAVARYLAPRAGLDFATLLTWQAAGAG